MKDTVYLRDLKVKCVIGTRTTERVSKQTLVLNVAMECDLSKAGLSDRLEDTVNYMRVRDRIVSRIGKSRFFLIERVAKVVAGICLESKLVKSVLVTVDKPGSVPGARSSAVEIRRRRGGR